MKGEVYKGTQRIHSGMAEPTILIVFRKRKTNNAKGTQTKTKHDVEE